VALKYLGLHLLYNIRLCKPLIQYMLSQISFGQHSHIKIWCCNMYTATRVVKAHFPEQVQQLALGMEIVNIPIYPLLISSFQCQYQCGWFDDGIGVRLRGPWYLAFICSWLEKYLDMRILFNSKMFTLRQSICIFCEVADDVCTYLNMKVRGWSCPWFWRRYEDEELFILRG
jgi:hypothetical protein